MITVAIRKQGGAAVMTIPAQVLKHLNVEVGSLLEVLPQDHGFVARTVQPKRRRLTVAELTEGLDAKTLKALHRATRDAREGDDVGREII